jgi:molecular chaperone GrpE
MTEPANASAANNNVADVENAAGSGAPATSGAPAEPAAAAAAAADAAALAQEAADYKDRLLRTLADMENLRRRTDREVAETRAYGIASFARDLVGVADNMRRALESAREGGGEAGGGGAKALLDGVELTERELLKVLEKHGVKQFDPQGAKFDPNLHQAMFEVPDPNVPAGSVVQVIQPGYMIGERVLRPAMVGVSKGGPKTAPPERSAEETQSS